MDITRNPTKTGRSDRGHGGAERRRNRGIRLLVALLSAGMLYGVAAAGGSAVADFVRYQAGEIDGGVFTNTTEETAVKLVVEYEGELEITNLVGVGADSLVTSGGEGRLIFEGTINARGSLHVDWLSRAVRFLGAHWVFSEGETSDLDLHAPTASIFVTSGVNESQIILDSSPSSDPDGGELSCSWELPDGTTALGPRIAFNSGEPGTYVVGLTVTDEEGLTATCERRIHISQPTPRVVMPQVIKYPLVYVSDEGGVTNLWMASLDLSEKVRLTDNEDPNVILRRPKWSPDGSRILYDVWTRESGDTYTSLWYYDTASRGSSKIFEASEADYGWASGMVSEQDWLSDNVVVFAMRESSGDSHYLHKINLDGTGLDTFLYLPGAEMRSTDVSRDGEYVVFIRTSNYWGYTGQVYTADSEGVGLSKLTSTSISGDVNNNRGCEFGADGETIFFLRGDSNRLWRLWRMNADGSEQVCISDEFPDDLHFHDWHFGVGSDRESLVLAARVVTEAELRRGGGKVLPAANRDLYLTDPFGLAIINLTNTPDVNERYPDLR